MQANQTQNLTAIQKKDVADMHGKIRETVEDADFFVIRATKLKFTSPGIDGVCSCVCISDCSCDGNW